MDAARLVRKAGARGLAELCETTVQEVREWAKSDWIPPLLASRIFRAIGLRFRPKPKRSRPYPGAPRSFFLYVRPNLGDGCWDWGGFVEKDGTARHYYAGRLWRAQRLAIEMVTFRPVPLNRVVVSSCGSKDCVNPDHLWAVPRGEAARDRARRARIMG